LYCALGEGGEEKDEEETGRRHLSTRRTGGTTRRGRRGKRCWSGTRVEEDGKI